MCGALEEGGFAVLHHRKNTKVADIRLADEKNKIGRKVDLVESKTSLSRHTKSSQRIDCLSRTVCARHIRHARGNVMPILVIGV
jgi:hypothetical protein